MSTCLIRRPGQGGPAAGVVAIMCAFNRPNQLLALVLGLCAWVGTGRHAAAAGPFAVHFISATSPQAVELYRPAAAAAPALWSLATTRETPIDDGRVVLNADGQQATLLSQGGRTVFVLVGPAEARFSAVQDGDMGRVDVALLRGRMITLRSGGEPDQAWFSCVGTDGRTILAEGPIGQGLMFMGVRTDALEIAIQPPTGQALGAPIKLGGEDKVLAPNQLVTYTMADRTLREIAFASLPPSLAHAVQDTGLQSANLVRGAVQNSLVSEVTQWDYSAQRELVLRVVEQPERIEIRQTAQTVTAGEQRVNDRGAAPQTPGFEGANQTFPYSPASSSVVFGAGFNDILRLSRQANGLLTRTGSRGLGFNGPSRLALPGTLRAPGGVAPAVGPAGLGAPP